MYCLLFFEFKDGCFDYLVFSDSNNQSACERAVSYINTLGLSDLDYFQIRFLTEEQFNHYKFIQSIK